MKWKITYYSTAVEDKILNLPKKLLARYSRLADLMVNIGPNLGEPHTVAMGGGLFELRPKAQEGIARVFFCTLIGKEIVMLHSIIKKTKKTPLKELRIAQQRLKEVQDEQ